MKETTIKIRIDNYLKEIAKGAAEMYNWNISKYIRHLIMADIESRFYKDMIDAIEKNNVATKAETFEIYHEGVKYKICFSNQGN